MLIDVTRRASVHTTLPVGELLLFSMTGREALGRPFEFDVELLSENANIGLSELLGQPISITLELADFALREFNGIVTHFSITGEVGRYVAYRATIRPWLWLLSQKVGSRIFQAKTVPDVAQQLFREHGFSDFSNALTAEYRSWEYLVQYRESDLDFVSRILELEGIYFFFKHKEGKHTLVLADSYSAHEPFPGYATVPYYPPQSGERRERDHVDRWIARRTIRPGVFAARDFNFTRPAAPVATELRAPLDHARNEYEVYDYPGSFQDSAEAEAQARIRLEEHQADFEAVQGQGNARGLGAGGLFKLSQFPRDDQNKEYLIIDATYEVSVGEYESMDRAEDPPDYRLSFVAIESSRPYRAPRLTPKPVVKGPQTATVVGQADQEIWTDEYGRVRLQFHWDREGMSDENSSCWVRVSQAWAGTNWGSIHVPRIGQEVIVDFLEGDPDRPIITGRVYNADNMPPYTLPENQTQSGIKSRSTKGGTPDNFNEIRFEDKKGEEELYLQAEKNMTTLVKNDQSTTVQANRSAGVTGNDSVSVGGDRSVSVTGNLSVTVSGGGKSAVHSTHSVTGKHSVDASDTIEVTAPTHIKLTVGDSSILITPSAITITAGGKASVVVDTNVLASGSGGGSTLIDANVLSKSDGGGSLLVDANVLGKSSAGHSLLVDGSTAQLKAGGSSLDVKPADITLDSTLVSGKGGGSELELAAAGAKMSGAKATIAGTGITEITGATVKIN
jgi:type VI secretion system secreted protein VgrG